MEDTPKQREEVPNKTLTPMFRQYNNLLKKCPGYILFYRLGDFYELFNEQALLISKELSLTMTKRGTTPMCGIPHNSAPKYIKRLVDLGYKVAIAEQMAVSYGYWEPRGLARREITHTITAATFMDDEFLEPNKSYYTAAFCMSKYKYECSCIFADITSGEISCLVIKEPNDKLFESSVVSQMAAYLPVEILHCNRLYEFPKIQSYLKNIPYPCSVDPFEYEPPDEVMELQQLIDLPPRVVLTEEYRRPRQVLPHAVYRGWLKSTSIKNPEDINLTPEAGTALAELLEYFQRSKFNSIKRFSHFIFQSEPVFMKISPAALKNLEIFTSLSYNSGKNSNTLFSTIDKTSTTAGRRMLKFYLEQPLTNIARIESRLTAVEELTQNIPLLDNFQRLLKASGDIQKLLTKAACKNCTPKEVYSLGMALSFLPKIKQLCESCSSPLMHLHNKKIISQELVQNLILKTISKNALPNFQSLKEGEGEIINYNANKELDEIRNLCENTERTLTEIETTERENTGIKSLKIGYNRILGYYIEVSKSYISKVPEKYIRKQTLTGGERYVTDELKTLEEKILLAREKRIAMEEDIFLRICNILLEHISEMHTTAEALSHIDVICSFAKVALEYNYQRPSFTLENIIDIKDGRHPTVERQFLKSLSSKDKINALAPKIFTSNDILLGKNDCKMMIITGPNMAGKSTYMRQIALIVIMAQIGCFVPARYCNLGICDKIFTRIGASDDISGGKSTFMVEMTEVAEILNDATVRSLVILDEIGRGTSTSDGVSIARAVAEYILTEQKLRCRTLFATHYHELLSLEDEFLCVKNFSVKVQKKKNENGETTLDFLHKIVKGGTMLSYGIDVAAYAGLPDKLIKNAKKYLKENYKNFHNNNKKSLTTSQEKKERSLLDYENIIDEN